MAHRNQFYDIFNRKIIGIAKIKAALEASTIFDKIEFSGITKEQVAAKLDDLFNRQVPRREVLLHRADGAVAEYWFKNWLHPMLKHAVPPASRDKRGCSREILKRDADQDTLRFYENGQQNFNYTLEDIESWLAED